MNWCAILLMLFLPFFASASGEQKETIDKTEQNERCCEKEILMLKGIINTPEIWRSDIFVSIDVSKEWGDSLNAGTYGCIWPEDETALTCEISVTEKLLRSFSREELVVVLAHEFGHITNPKQDHGISGEYYADEFSFKILGELDMDQKAALSASQKILKDMQPLTNKQKIIELTERIARIKRLLEAGNTNRPQ